MCRTFECYVKVRLCFSGGSHNPVDMATFISSILSAMFTRVCGKPEKQSLALVPCSYILCMIVKLTYAVETLTNQDDKLASDAACCFEKHKTETVDRKLSDQYHKEKPAK